MCARRHVTVHSLCSGADSNEMLDEGVFILLEHRSNSGLLFWLGRCKSLKIHALLSWNCQGNTGLLDIKFEVTSSDSYVWEEKW